MKFRNMAAAALAAASFAGVAAGPALASARTAFAVQDNGGVLVTRYPLAARQQFYCGGTAYTARTVQGSYGTYTVTVTPGFPAADIGKTVPCST